AYFEEYLLEDAELLVISYGSVARSAKRAVLDARSRGYKVGFLKLITLWPFMEDIVLERAERVRTVLVPEMNMGQVIREVQRLVHDHKKVRGINRIDGTIITPNEILQRIMELYS
ncbi:MAG: transketolase C-terminal domain-containing protein, partial [Nitrospirota bacterium]